MKENWFRVCVLILAVLILGGLFYWFQIRTAQIRKECAWKAENPTASTDSEFVSGSIAKKFLGENYFDEKAYNKCLLENGLDR